MSAYGTPPMHDLSRGTSLVRTSRRVLSLQIPVVVAFAALACGRGSVDSLGDAREGAPASVAARVEDDSVQRRDVTVLTIFSRIREDPLTRGRDISVAARGSTLFLTGRVPTEEIHARVLQIVHGQLGGFALVDSLVVDPAAPDPPGSGA